MNNGVYLILIFALLALSAFMLYARFAARARENSPAKEQSENEASQDTPDLSPVEQRFSAEEEIGAPDEAPEIPMTSASEPLVMDLRPLQAESETGKPSTDRSATQGEYLDELQEAAAGLAMLMRSSSVRPETKPMVFGPAYDENGNEVVEGVEGGVGGEPPVEGENQELEIQGDQEASEMTSVVEDEALVVLEEPETAEEPVVEELVIVEEEPRSLDEAIDEVEALLDQGPVFEASEPEFAGEQHSTLEQLLGGEVVDQLGQLDSGLDELESVVEKMEEQLQALEIFVSSPLEGEEASEAEAA